MNCAGAPVEQRAAGHQLSNLLRRPVTPPLCNGSGVLQGVRAATDPHVPFYDCDLGISGLTGHQRFALAQLRSTAV